MRDLNDMSVQINNIELKKIDFKKELLLNTEEEVAFLER